MHAIILGLGNPCLRTMGALPQRAEIELKNGATHLSRF